MPSPFTTSTAGAGRDNAGENAAPSHLNSASPRVELGEFHSEYRGNPLIYLAFGIPCLLLGSYSLWSGVTSGAVEFTGSGLILIFTTAILLGRGKLISARKLVRYQGGMILSDQWRSHVVPWSEFRSIRQYVVQHSVNFVPTGKTRKYYLITADGTHFTLDNHFPKVEMLAEDIQVQITRVQLPILLQQFQQGTVVEFGPLKFDRTGISYGRGKITWPDLESFRIERGIIRIQRRGDKAGKMIKGATISVSVPTLPNLRLMIEFVNRVRAAHSRTRTQ